MSDYIQANTNGRLHDAVDAAVSPLNRGYLFGDAIYEVWRTYDNVVFTFDEHMERFSRSAEALHFRDCPQRDDVLREIRRTTAAFRDRTDCSDDLYIRMQFTRGSGPIGLDVNLSGSPEWVILVQALLPRLPADGRAGLYLSVARDLHRNPPRALNPAWKTGNYLNNLLCLREARSRGADEVVILDAGGGITEAAVCNIFFVRGRTLVTPPLDVGILDGITRRLILEKLAGEAGFAVCEESIKPSDLGSFDECFLTASTRDVSAVGRIDDHTYPVGEDTVTARLKSGFRRFAAAYAAAHPELRV